MILMPPSCANLLISFFGCSGWRRVEVWRPSSQKTNRECKSKGLTWMSYGCYGFLVWPEKNFPDWTFYPGVNLLPKVKCWLSSIQGSHASGEENEGLSASSTEIQVFVQFMNFQAKVFQDAQWNPPFGPCLHGQRSWRSNIAIGLAQGATTIEMNTVRTYHWSKIIDLYS